MFRIRRIFDDIILSDRDAIAQVQSILRQEFNLVPTEEIAKLRDKLRNPLRYRLRHIIHVAEDHLRRVKGFSIMAHAPDLKFCFLDYISAATGMTGRGIGGALYEQLREEARSLGVIGLFFECLPDDPKLCLSPALLKENAARLRFYERYGARPLMNTGYETPLKAGEPCPPYLVFDDLGQKKPLKKGKARHIVRAILERQYGNRCPPGYIDKVVRSLKDDPVQLRPPLYVKKMHRMEMPNGKDRRIALVVNDTHEIHHVRDRGYVQSPVRIKAILKQIERTKLFTRLRPDHYGLRYITAIHDSRYVAYLGRACSKLEPGKSIYPYVFPIRNASRPPRELPVRAGYYCIDTFTPLNQNAYQAARRAVECALTAADAVLQGGFRLSYALVRPPGHHAERRVFGGFCYFNSAAATAEYLTHYGRVAVLDIDYHHGNGTQDIFYDRADVLTVSIHGHPSFAYPYFSGFADEKGVGAGLGFNLNLPLPENGVDGERYRRTLTQALKRLAHFRPRFLIVSLGLDPAKGDPTGTWILTAGDFYKNGKMIGRLGLPTVVVQEGGYRTRSLGANARNFFAGLSDGSRLSCLT